MTLELVAPQTGILCGTVQIEIVQLDLRVAISQLDLFVFEYERWAPVHNWGSKFPGNMLPTDPGNESGPCLLVMCVSLSVCLSLSLIHCSSMIL